MDCSCTVPGNDGEMENGGVQIRTARKTHRCCECGETIQPGDSYHFHTCFGDGTISNHKVCNDCQAVIDRFFDNGWWFGMVWDMLGDYLADNWRDDLPTSCIVKLPPKARAKVCDILQEVNQGD